MWISEAFWQSSSFGIRGWDGSSLYSSRNWGALGESLNSPWAPTLARGARCHWTAARASPGSPRRQLAPPALAFAPSRSAPSLSRASSPHFRPSIPLPRNRCACPMHILSRNRLLRPVTYAVPAEIIHPPLPGLRETLCNQFKNGATSFTSPVFRFAGGGSSRQVSVRRRERAGS